MNEKQKQFCLEYLKDFNGARAYRVVYAGGKPLKSARSSAHRLMQKDDVQNFLKSKIDTAYKEKVAEANEVMAYFTSVMRGEIDMNDRERNKAAELLAKRHGLLEERVLATGDGGGVTIVDDV